MSLPKFIARPLVQLWLNTNDASWLRQVIAADSPTSTDPARTLTACSWRETAWPPGVVCSPTTLAYRDTSLEACPSTPVTQPTSTSSFKLSANKSLPVGRDTCWLNALHLANARSLSIEIQGSRFYFN